VSEVGGSNHIGFFSSGYNRYMTAGIRHSSMEMQQLIEMLAEIKANRKANGEDLKEMMNATQEGIHANIKEMR
jgi:hypothetical protein